MMRSLLLQNLLMKTVMGRLHLQSGELESGFMSPSRIENLLYRIKELSNGELGDDTVGW